MASNQYTVTVKLDEESRAIIQNTVNNLERIEGLLTETVKLFTANFGKVLNVEITENQK